MAGRVDIDGHRTWALEEVVGGPAHLVGLE
jgi:hypothetical protein